PPIDRQDLIAAACACRGASYPDLFLRCYRRQVMNLADRVEYGLVASHGESMHLFTAFAVREDVVELAVVPGHIDGDVGIEKRARQMLLNGGLRLFQGQARNIYAAVASQADRAIGTDQVFAANLLGAPELDQRNHDLRFLDELAEMFYERALNLIHGEI